MCLLMLPAGANAKSQVWKRTLGWKDRMIEGFVFLSPAEENLSLCFARWYSRCSISMCLLRLPAGATAKSQVWKWTPGWKDRMIGGFVFLSPAEENLPLCYGSGRRAMNILCYFPRTASRCSLPEGLHFLVFVAFDLIFGFHIFWRGVTIIFVIYLNLIYLDFIL